MWPFRRRSADEPASGADAAGDGADVLRPARSEWRSVEPLRPVQAMSLTMIDHGFEQSLTTRAQPLFIDSLSHHVRPTAPAGTVDGLATPSPGVSEGVLRSYAAPAPPVQRITSAAVTPPPSAMTPMSPSTEEVAPSTPAPVASPPPPVEPAPAVDASPSPHEAPAAVAPPSTTLDDADVAAPAPVVEAVTERPLLDERAPLIAISTDDHSPADAPPAVDVGGRSAEPRGPVEVQRRVDLVTPNALRPAMRIGAPLPPNTDRNLVGQRESTIDDGPLTTVTRHGDEAPAAPVTAPATHGPDSRPDATVQRAQPNVPPRLDDSTGSETGPTDDAADLPTVRTEAADQRSDDVPAQPPTADAPLVGDAPIGSVPASDGAPEPSSGPGPLAERTVATSRPPALQRTVFDTPTPAAASPSVIGRAGDAASPIAPRVVARSLVPEVAAAAPADVDAPVTATDAPLVGAADPLVDMTGVGAPANEAAPAPTVAGPGAPVADDVAGGADVAWAAAPATTAPVPDSGLLGERPPTLTIDWSDGRSPAVAPDAVSGRIDSAARPSAPAAAPPVVARQRLGSAAPTSAATTPPGAIHRSVAAAPGLPPVLQFGPPPTPAAPVLSFDPAPAEAGARHEEVTSFEQPVALQRQALGDAAAATEIPIVQTASVASAAPSSAADAATGAPAATSRSEAEIVELARVLYPQLQRRLARDLLVDRERAGYRTDIRF